MSKKLVWEQKYSVGVEIIDKQHQMMFDTINLLIDTINSGPTEKKLLTLFKDLSNIKNSIFKLKKNILTNSGTKSRPNTQPSIDSSMTISLKYKINTKMTYSRLLSL